MLLEESSAKYGGLVLSKDNPFREQIERALVESSNHRKGLIAQEEVTITMKRTYMRGLYTKVFKNKELLRDLSPYACKILVHIALHLGMEEEKMKISRVEIGMGRKPFTAAMLELLTKGIILNENKREWYWVNLTLIIVGNVHKHE